MLRLSFGAAGLAPECDSLGFNARGPFGPSLCH